MTFPGDTNLKYIYIYWFVDLAPFLAKVPFFFPFSFLIKKGVWPCRYAYDVPLGDSDGIHLMLFIVKFCLHD